MQREWAIRLGTWAQPCSKWLRPTVSVWCGSSSGTASVRSCTRTRRFRTTGLDAAGNIYGATSSIVFELSPNGSGGWNPSVIHAFTGAPKDGAVAAGTPVLDRAGNLYGTTERGGAKNFGAVYKLSPGKKGNWTEKILHSFKNSRADGNEPWAGVVLDADGNIYGTTVTGGKYGYRHGGYGALFELVAPVGVGRYREKIQIG